MMTNQMTFKEMLTSLVVLRTKSSTNYSIFHVDKETFDDKKT